MIICSSLITKYNLRVAFLIVLHFVVLTFSVQFLILISSNQVERAELWI